jgi:arylsulfatase
VTILLAAASAQLGGVASIARQAHRTRREWSPMAGQKKPNIVMIMADDVSTWNLSSYHRGMMGGSTPNIDRIARDGPLFH